ASGWSARARPSSWWRSRPPSNSSPPPAAGDPGRDPVPVARGRASKLTASRPPRRSLARKEQAPLSAFPHTAVILAVVILATVVAGVLGVLAVVTFAAGPLWRLCRAAALAHSQATHDEV